MKSCGWNRLWAAPEGQVEGVKDIGARRSAGMAGPLLFILLMLVSGLSVCYRLPVWVRYAVDVILIAWAAAAFLIRPQRKRLGFCLTLAAVCLIPFLFAWLWSLGVWVIRLEEPAYIARGSRNTLYMLVNALFVGAVFYLFGRRGAAYVLCGMALANGAVLAQAVAKEGVLTLAREYATLLLTWTGQTGTAVARLELHDIVFAWGAFVIHGLVSGKGRRGRERWGTLTAAFFFVLSLKRIAVAGVILACVAAVIWRRISGQRCFLWVMAVAGMAAALAWVDLVRSGALAQIAALLHINMMGRESTYAMYDAVYEFSPLYMGRGIRFVYEYGLLNGVSSSMHSVYVEQFIALGFIGMAIWMLTVMIPLFFVSGRYGGRAAAFLVAATVYLLVTYVTDNTLFHYPVNTVIWLLTMNECAEGGRVYGDCDDPYADI